MMTRLWRSGAGRAQPSNPVLSLSSLFIRNRERRVLPGRMVMDILDVIIYKH